MDKYKTGIEIIENLSEKYRIKFKIKYGVSRTVVDSNKVWYINVMDKTFSNEDFLKALADAIIFILRAHGENLSEDLNRLISSHEHHSN